MEEGPTVEANRPDPAASANVQGELQQVADLVRSAHHLGPEAQRALADLVEEMGRDLAATSLADPVRQQLAESVARLAQALHERHNEGMLAAAKERLAEAAARAEARAPVATGVALRLMDVLANLGI